MSRNTLVAIVVVALVVVIGIFVAYQTPQSNVAIVPTDNSDTNGTSNLNTDSNPAVQAPQAGIPIVVGDSNVTASNSTAVVAGRVNPNGALTTYIYEYGDTTAMNNSTSAQTLGSGYGSINAPAYITGLKANTLYYFRLSAQNTFGGVHGAMYSFMTNSTPPTPAIAPSATTNSASGISRTTANLNAQVNPKGSETTFWFEYGQNTNFANDTVSKVLSSSNTLSSVSVSVANLAPATKYYFRINAQNRFGTVNGATMTLITSGPASSGNPSAATNSASKISTSAATLSGKVSPNGVDTTYWFEYSKDSLLGSVVGTATPNGSLLASISTSIVTADLSGLSRHTKYFFRLVAKNQYATVRGEQLSFTTK
jgi:phosphodiesterase/alkaline phosphatase D-like protein